MESPRSTTLCIWSSGPRLPALQLKPAVNESTENGPPGATSGCDGSPGATTLTEALGKACGAALPANGSVKTVTLASKRAGGLPPSGTSATVSPTSSWGVTPSAAFVSASWSPIEDASGLKMATDHALAPADALARTLGACTPSSPATLPSHFCIGAGDPANSDRSHVAIAV